MIPHDAPVILEASGEEDNNDLEESATTEIIAKETADSTPAVAQTAALPIYNVVPASSEVSSDLPSGTTSLRRSTRTSVAASRM